MGTVHHFAASLSDDPDDRLKAERRNLLMKAAFKLNGSDQTHSVTIRDISSTGMKAATSHAPLVGGKIDVEIPGVGTVSAKVVWAACGKMGVRFAQIIDLSQAKIHITGSYASIAVEPVPDLRRL